MNKQLLVFRRLQCFVGTTFASFPAILIIISSLHQFANKQYFLLLKNQQLLNFFSQIIPNLYLVVGLELEPLFSEKVSTFHLRISSSEEWTAAKVSYSCG